ncbi:hypothetical protein B0H15DRAFT_949799 [Mycena belliarum]|uniref:Glycosyltransferase subfamily 4-like N-terminal domain-containing protein n=1 Tax=Mycena belliarum TaxID=1033014 RepID=A0AAD6XLU2_9AGAR|nr:hypothetical protein B0H15DRAFT_949799 [Mycena belliae]
MPAPLLPVHNGSAAAKDVEDPLDSALRVAIITENFLPKIDGSTITLAHLLQHLRAAGVRAMLFGPASPLREYAGAPLFGTAGVPLRVYPGLKINFLSPALLAALRAFAPDVVHLVDPIWLGVQGLAAVRALFPHTPVVTSHHTNLATYAAVFGYPYSPARVWRVQGAMHGVARCTLVPSASTAGLLTERGWRNLRVCERGVDCQAFDPALRSPSLRASWGARPHDVVILSVGRLSPEKNLELVVDAFVLLQARVGSASGQIKTDTPQPLLVFVGDGPYAAELKTLCAARGVRAVFTGQLTGRALGEAFASGDVMCSPSITETFGQVTLQGMASGLPVVGLYVEGTADLVAHGETGLLLDVRGAVAAAASGPSITWDAPAKLTLKVKTDTDADPGPTSALWPGSPSPISSSSAASASPPKFPPISPTKAAPPYTLAVPAYASSSASASASASTPAYAASPADGDSTPASPLLPAYDARPGSPLLPAYMLAPSAMPCVPSAFARFADDDGCKLTNPIPASLDPSTLGKDVWSPLAPLAPDARVGCYASLAPLMGRAEVAERFAALLGALVCDAGDDARGGLFPRQVAGAGGRDAEDVVVDSDRDLEGPAARRRHAMGRRARAKAEGYRWEAALGRMLDAYREAVGDLPSESGVGGSSAQYCIPGNESAEQSKCARGCGEGSRPPQGRPATRAGAPGNGAALGWGVQGVVDGVVVLHALVAATLSHAAYMVPTREDLFGA